MAKEFFQSLAVAQSSLQLRDQLGWHIHAAAAPLVSEGEDESWMFIAAGAGRAVGPDAGLTDLSQ